MQDIRITTFAPLPGMGLYRKIKGFKKNLVLAFRVTQEIGHHFFIAGNIKFFFCHTSGECLLLFTVI